jgi:hypothetical protein
VVADGETRNPIACKSNSASLVFFWVLAAQRIDHLEVAVDACGLPIALKLTKGQAHVWPAVRTRV